MCPVNPCSARLGCGLAAHVAWFGVASRLCRPPSAAGVSRAGARTGLQLPGHGDMQGLNSSSPASLLVSQCHRVALDLVVVGSSPTVGVLRVALRQRNLLCCPREGRAGPESDAPMRRIVNARGARDADHNKLRTNQTDGLWPAVGRHGAWLFRCKHESWSRAVSTLQRSLHSTLGCVPTTADGAQFCLLCCQPEPVPESSPARQPSLTRGCPCRPPVW